MKEGAQGAHLWIHRLTVDLPRWLFLAVLVYSPWAKGATTPGTIHDVETALGVILVLWMGGCALRRLSPSIPRLLIVSVMLVLLWGWAMTLNPHLQDAGGYTFATVRPRIPWFPGTVDRAASLRMMERVACLLGAICFVSDLSARRAWRRRIWWTIGAAGVSIVLFGLVQSGMGKPLFVWDENELGPYFATYYYHGNAGAFINLVLPFVAGLGAITLRNHDAYLQRAIWFPGFFICVAGAFVNLSRSAAVITCILSLILIAWQFFGRSRYDLLPPRRVRIAYVVLMVGALAGMVAFSGWERPAQKWAMMRSQLNSANKRFVSTEVCLRMLKGGGWHGFGPGTFELTFPHYTGDLAPLIPGIWRYAHDDYLQTILEWGVPGAALFAVIFFGGMAYLFINWRKRRDWSTSDRVLAFVAGLALAGVAAHAFVDFPLQIMSLQLYAAVCVGLGWGCRRWDGIKRQKPFGSSPPEQKSEQASESPTPA